MRPEPFLLLLLLLLAILYFFWQRGASPSQNRWRTKDALAAIKHAGLPMTDIHHPGDERLLLNYLRPDVIFFHIPASNSQGNCYIFSLPSALQADQLFSSGTGPQPTSPDIATLTFTHGNLYVMAFGDVPIEMLKGYEAAIRTLQVNE